MSESPSDKIRAIKLTQEGKKPQKPVIFITDPEMALALDDQAKLEIIRILRNGIRDSHTTEEYNADTGEKVIRQWNVRRHSLSVSEIVKQSKHDGSEPLTRNQVYHHIPRLIEAGYAIKYGTVTTGKRTTDYFRRTAQTFVLLQNTPAVNEKFLMERMAKDLDDVKKVFGLGISQEQKKELIHLGVTMWQMKDEWASILLHNLREDLVDSGTLRLYDWLLELYMVGVNEYVQLGQRMREILLNSNKE